MIQDVLRKLTLVEEQVFRKVVGLHRRQGERNGIGRRPCCLE